jgi:glycosyltransferase involved in cell wall biosynthesis
MTSRVVIGAPLYNHADDLPETLESLLTQSFRDFVLVCVDDQSSDATGEIVQRYAAQDARISYSLNTRRLGMIGNWRRAFELGMEQAPEAEFFAWASDHDIWHPRWLATLLGELDRHHDTVLVYPRNGRIGPDGLITDKRPWTFETIGVEDQRVRFRRTMRHMSAGNMIYGLARTDAIRRAGVFRHVLVPDRLLLMELALEGQFRQVPEVLWFRRYYGRIFSLARQRRAFFPDGRPLYAYLPWWIGHAIVMAVVLGVLGERRPQISRATGFRLGGRYLRLSGMLHLRQQLRQLRFNLFQHATFLKPIYMRCRGTYKEGKRRLSKSRRRWSEILTCKKKRQQFVTTVRGGVTKRVRAAVFPAGRGLLRVLRSLPLMRNQVIPWLVNEEINQVPSGPAIYAMRKEITELSKGKGYVIVGPWLSEVGFEVLYWIPFLTWVVESGKIEPDRMIVVSRGGAHVWYRDLATHHEEIFDLMSVKEFRKRNTTRWGSENGGNQKQNALGAFDNYIIKLVKARRGITNVQVLHPSVMYKLFRYYWYEKGAMGLLYKYTAYRPMPMLDGNELVRTLPQNYIAVKFYFRSSFPDTAANRKLVRRIIRTLAERTPVVLLNTGLNVDDHEDFDPGTGRGIHDISHLMTPARNLELQSTVIAGASMFIGTYGGLSYLGPFYGVPTIALFACDPERSRQRRMNRDSGKDRVQVDDKRSAIGSLKQGRHELVAAHLDVSHRLSRRFGVSLVTLDVRELAIIETLLGAVDRVVAPTRETVDSEAPTFSAYV